MLHDAGTIPIPAANRAVGKDAVGGLDVGEVELFVVQVFLMCLIAHALPIILVQFGIFCLEELDVVFHFLIGNVFVPNDVMCFISQHGYISPFT